MDTSDPKEVQKAIKDAKSKDAIAVEGLKTMMQSEAGRVWLSRLINMCSTMVNAFSSDSNVMSFRCGEINIGLQIIADMHEASPELYLLTLKENKS
jgi:hypothetical protein